MTATAPSDVRPDPPRSVRTPGLRRPVARPGRGRPGDPRGRRRHLRREFVFGVARQLFDEVVRDSSTERDELFAGAARFAAPLLEVEYHGASAPSDDPFAARLIACYCRDCAAREFGPLRDALEQRDRRERGPV